VSAQEVISEYEAGLFPALKKPEAQMAMVQLVEREGYGAVIAEVVAEESAVSSEERLAATGFRALMKVVEQGSAQIEEVMTHIEPEDFEWDVSILQIQSKSENEKYFIIYVEQYFSVLILFI
jgi:hypothetical protein